MGLLTTLAQTTSESYENYMIAEDSAGAGAFMLVWSLIWLALAVVLTIAIWKVFTKAGQPGWASIIPIYSSYILIKIAARPGWWLLLAFIPFVNLVVWLFLSLDIAKAFGKDEVFGVALLWLLSPVGFAILGFGDATYSGPSAPSAPVAPATPGAPTAPAV